MTECWYISKNIHTSYNDILQISVKERKELVRLIKEDIERQSEQLKKSVASKNKQKGKR